MADRQRPDRHGGPFREGRQRHLIARGRRLDVELVERVELALQFRQDLQDHVIAVELGEILRDLALAERVVQRVVDQLRLDAEAGGGVAVDRQRQRGALGLLVGGDVAQLRQRPHLVEDLRRPFVQLVEIGVLQRELELGPGRAAAEADVLGGLHEQPGALHLVELRPQPGDDLLGAGIALVARLQRDVHAPGIEGAAAAADEHGDAGDGGIGLHDPAEFLLMPLHVREGNVLRRFRSRGEQPVILLREKSLGDDHEQIDRQGRAWRRRSGASSCSSATPGRGRAHRRAAWRRRRARSTDRSGRAGFRLRARRKRDAIIGVSVSDTTSDTKIAIASVTANSRNSRPMMPPISNSGISTATSEMLIERW